MPLVLRLPLIPAAVVGLDQCKAMEEMADLPHLLIGGVEVVALLMDLMVAVHLEQLQLAAVAAQMRMDPTLHLALVLVVAALLQLDQLVFQIRSAL